MTIYTDSSGRIMAAGSTDRTDLTAVELDESAIDYPFKGWSDIRICCYRIQAQRGHITMMTPYVPTHMIAVLETQDSKITSAEQMITDLDLQSIATEQAITDMDLKLLEVGA